MDKIYTSTRNKTLARTGKEAILKGIAEDGGLFVYDALDTKKLPIKDMMQMSYEEMAVVVLQTLLPDFTQEEVYECVEKAYRGKFHDERITPLHRVGDAHILELFHGPTCAFKDIGLRMLPQLMSASLQTHNDKDIMILTATSGDTGKAALEGFLDVEHIGITVFYPNHGVSNIQRLQMVTSEGKNTCVCAIDGNFDDAQSNVKKIFQNTALEKRFASYHVQLSSANSINIGRLIPQIVYYIYAYREMVRKEAVPFGEEINFCVPTGNFGNVLAGYYAKMMGLPVHKLIVASNANNVLYDFLQHGIYDRKRPFYKTISPSMDILISSNLERLLYYTCGKDTTYINELMDALQKTGKYQVSDTVLKKLQQSFYGGFCDDESCAAAIRALYKETGYVMDPHTAIAYKVMKEYEQTDAEHKTVLVSTASPYKFAPAVYQAIFEGAAMHMDEFMCMDMLQQKTGAKIPAPLKKLKEKAIQHTHCIDKNDMITFVEKIAKEMFYD